MLCFLVLKKENSKSEKIAPKRIKFHLSGIFTTAKTEMPSRETGVGVTILQSYSESRVYTRKFTEEKVFFPPQNPYKREKNFQQAFFR